MDGFIVGFSCRDFKAKRVTIFVDVKNGAFRLELLGVSSDITKSRGDISFKRTCLVLPVRLGAIDFPQVPPAERIDGISSRVCLREVIPGPIAYRIGHDIASQFFCELNELDIIETGAVNKYTGTFLKMGFLSSPDFRQDLVEQSIGFGNGQT